VSLDPLVKGITINSTKKYEKVSVISELLQSYVLCFQALFGQNKVNFDVWDHALS
jgi:hypothetical protein